MYTDTFHKNNLSVSGLEFIHEISFRLMKIFHSRGHTKLFKQKKVFTLEKDLNSHGIGLGDQRSMASVTDVKTLCVCLP